MNCRISTKRFFCFLICYIFLCYFFGGKKKKIKFNLWCFDVVFGTCTFFVVNLISHEGFVYATHNFSPLLIEIWYAVRWIRWKHLLFICLFLSTRHENCVLENAIWFNDCFMLLKQQTFRRFSWRGGGKRQVEAVLCVVPLYCVDIHRQVDSLLTKKGRTQLYTNETKAK